MLRCHRARFGDFDPSVESRLDRLEQGLQGYFELKSYGTITDETYRSFIERYLQPVDFPNSPNPTHSPAQDKGLPTATMPAHAHIMFRLEKWQMLGYISEEHEYKLVAYVKRWKEYLPQAVVRALDPPLPEPFAVFGPPYSAIGDRRALESLFAPRRSVARQKEPREDAGTDGQERLAESFA